MGKTVSMIWGTETVCVSNKPTPMAGRGVRGRSDRSRALRAEASSLERVVSWEEPGRKSNPPAMKPVEGSVGVSW